MDSCWGRCWLWMVLATVGWCGWSPSPHQSSLMVRKPVQLEGLSHERLRVCNSMDIKNYAANIRRIAGCNIIDGYLHIALMEHATEDDFRNLSFPELREVSQFIIFFRVRGLTSIGRLFPNLRVIRGEQVFGDFSLIVTKSWSLREVNLPGLVIPRGGVIIYDNKNLCYWNTVNWTRVAPNAANEVGANSDECPPCPHCPSGFCWNETHCQDPEPDTSMCDEQCVGGCSGPGPENCHSCKSKIVDGVCREACPPDRYAFEDRYCVTEENCHSLKGTFKGLNESKEMIPFDGICSQECPPRMEYDSEVTCKKCIRDGVWTNCVRVCSGAMVGSLSSAQLLANCTHIDGSLIIKIKRMTKNELVAEELLKHLGKIEQISGQLQITESDPIVNLNFLQNLWLINGSAKNNSGANYPALVIYDNPNLVGLWDWSIKPGGKNFSLGAGTVSIHYNPKLCMSHIRELVEILGVNDTYREVATESNGIRCNINIDVTFVSKNESSVRVTVISLEKFSMDDRYVVYYSESNVTETPDEDLCDDSWRIADNTEVEYGEMGEDGGVRTVTYVIGGLKAFTKYAGFVKIYALKSQWGQTAVQYFTTLSGKPTRPTVIRANGISSREILVAWSPPKKPNGKISEYVLTGTLEDDKEDLLKERDYCLNRPIEQPVTLPPTTPPTTTTTPASENIDCCEEERRREKALMEEKRIRDICDQPSLRPPTYVSKKATFDELETCDKYFYDAVEEKISVNLTPQRPLIKFSDIESGLNTIRDDDVKRKNLEKVTTGQEEFNDDGTFKKFIKTVNGSTMTTVIGNLRHYGLYIIEVKACRSWDSKEEKDRNVAEFRCSHSSVVALRTQRSPEADIIDQQFIWHNVQNKSVQIYWKKPANPNGLIVSYVLKFWRTDVGSSEPISKCVTSLQHETNGAQYTIENLDIGLYALTVQAISLYGEGPASQPIHFDLTERPSISVIISLSVAIAITCAAIIAGSLFLVYYRRKLIMESILVATVNPEYASLTQYVDDEWEVCRDNVEILREIKQGNFGMVYEGILHPDKRRCAVKTVIESAAESDCVEFLNEASIMKAFKGAYHIVNLLGVVSKTRPPLVVMELMALGDMKSFLRMSRNSPQYPSPSPARLLIMAAEIADGMAFLESRKFVHRDLAARNCMVSEDLTVKIGDFGMTRDIYETDYYKKGNKGLLPIRWMAPESLNDGVFTTHSDVWSYGIVLWEMTTLASQPYQGLANEQVLQHVISGNKLDIPQFCPHPLGPIMAQCWKWKPKLRPSFLTILSHFEEYVGDEFREVSFYHSSEGLEARHLAEQAAINKAQESATVPSLNTAL